MSVVVAKTTKARVKLAPVTVSLADLSYLADPNNWEKAPKKKRVVKKKKAAKKAKKRGRPRSPKRKSAKRKSKSPSKRKAKSPKRKKADKSTAFKKAFTARVEKAKAKGQVIDVSDLKADGTGASSKVISAKTTKFVKVPGFTGVVSSSKRGVTNLEKLTGRKELSQKWADRKKKGGKRAKSPKRKSPRAKSPKRKSPKRKSPRSKSPKKRSPRAKSPKSPRLPPSPGVTAMSPATSPAGMPALPVAPASPAGAVRVPSVPGGLPTIQAGSPLL